MSYPKNQKLLVCDKCGAERSTLIKVVVQKSLAVFEEKHCVGCVVLPMYKTEGVPDVFTRRNYVS